MRYVLDTSAVLAYYQNEPGAGTVGEILRACDSGEASLSISYMTVFELLYLLTAEEGPEAASRFLMKVRDLPIEEVWPDEDLAWRAAEIKARGGVSVADAFVAATASLSEAVLVHRDAELERLDPTIKTLSLLNKT